MHYSSPLRQSHDNWIIGGNDGISDGHFPEIHTHNILIGEGTFNSLSTFSLEYLLWMQCKHYFIYFYR